MNLRALAACCVLVLPALWVRAFDDSSTTRPVDESDPLAVQVDHAIQRGVKFLLSRQRDGGYWNDGVGDDHEVGQTALIGLALLNCGVSHQSPEIVRTIEYLKKQRPDQTYVVALRAAFYSQLPEAVRRTELPADLRWLLQAQLEGDFDGLYTYTTQLRGFFSADYSNSQYGVLGVWYASQAGLEVPQEYWRRVEQGWKRGQTKDGGWGYVPTDSNPYASMTAAAAATLYVTNDALHAAREKDLTKPVINRPLEKAVQWLGDHFAVDRNPGRDSPLRPRGADDPAGVFAPRQRMRSSWLHYMLYSYERVGEASGLTRFGKRKWFDEGARHLVNTQDSDGSWESSIGAEIDTAYSLLFLSRGRAPVAIQKLQFADRWNNRSRDVATFVRWLSHQSERHTNWQIVGTDATQLELREAPMLYIASDRAIKLKDYEKQKLKTYVEQGGLIVAIAEGTGREFPDSIVKLASELFPKYEFRDMPDNHLIFQQNFPTKGANVPLRSVSNGVRELIILAPSGDLSWQWQKGAGTRDPTKAPLFGLLGNLVLYASDKANPRYKGQDTWIDPDPIIVDGRSMTVARLKYGENWNPEPAGWLRLANHLHNTAALKLETAEVTISTELPSQPLAHMTATGPVELSTTAMANLRKYLDGGGFLLFDAAGGSATAATSFEALLAQLYPEGKLQRLPMDHPVYVGVAGGAKISDVGYRKFAQSRLPRTTLPRLQGFTVNGKLIAIYSAEDLSAGLVGAGTDGIVGYTPGSATDLVSNIILWRSTQPR